MAQPDDLEPRVATLETQVQDLAKRVRHSEQDAAAGDWPANRLVGILHGCLRHRTCYDEATDPDGPPSRSTATTLTDV